MKRRLAVLGAAGLVLCTVAAAHETRLRVEDNGVLGAMHRLGCSPAWLSVVMRESNLLESELNSLPRGTRIVAPDECGRILPSRADRLITRKIFGEQAAIASAERAENEAAELRTEMAAQETRLTAAIETRVEGQFGKQLKVATARADKAEQALRIDISLRHALTWIFGVGIALLVVFGWFGLFKPLRERLEELRIELEDARVRAREANLEALERRVDREATVVSISSEPEYPTELVYQGKVISFRDMSEHYLGCPYCHESRLKPAIQNMRQHLDRVHPEIRIEERPAAEILDMLAKQAS